MKPEEVPCRAVSFTPHGSLWLDPFYEGDHWDISPATF